MTDTPTMKALVSTVLTFALIFVMGTVTNAIGQNTARHSTTPAASPYENVETKATSVAHNNLESARTQGVAHNTP